MDDSQRFVLIEYAATGGTHVGTGYAITSRAVLTADHVLVDLAEGRTPTVTRAGKALPVAQVVRSGDIEKADLAVLVLKESIPGLDAVPCSRLDRGSEVVVGGCVATGYPKWKKDAGGRATAHVEGKIPASEGLHARNEPAGEFLVLKVDELPPRAIEFPDVEEERGTDPENPWAGMSGAAVTAPDHAGQRHVVGAVRGWGFREGIRSLTVVPLTALKLLSASKQEAFRSALGLADGELPLLDAPGTPGPAIGPADPGTAPGRHPPLPRYARERLKSCLYGIAELPPVPETWNDPALDQIHEGLMKLMDRHAPVPGVPVPEEWEKCREADDVVQSVRAAALALPVLKGIKPADVTRDKLRQLYERHVGGWPSEKAGTAEEMLIDAASASIREARLDESGSWVPDPLARFMLAIAGLRQPAGEPAKATLDDARLAGMADWLTGTLGLELGDARKYLDEEVGGRCWALIELVAPETPEKNWPDRIVVDRKLENGEWSSANFPCSPPSEEALEEALRKAVDSLPPAKVFIDLCLPRPWLDAGVVEHLKVIGPGEYAMSLSEYGLRQGGRYELRLRWALPMNQPSWMNLMKRRFEQTDWTADPVDIPADLIASGDGIGEWLDKKHDRYTDQRCPPFFIGRGPRAGGHDPLGDLLARGHCFVAWLCGTDAGPVPETGEAKARLRESIAAVQAGARRHEIPGLLSRELRRLNPAVIWNDPTGREDFPMPHRNQTTR